MKFLIFALLALSASAEYHQSYSPYSWDSYNDYSHGLGYGSSLYGSSYGGWGSYYKPSSWSSGSYYDTANVEPIVDTVVEAPKYHYKSVAVAPKYTYVSKPAVTSYVAPAVSYVEEAKPAVTSYVAPAISYAKPAVTSYVAPAVTYAKPAVRSYVAPSITYAKPAVTSYVAPAVTYAKPAVTSYVAPAVSYAKPAVTSYVAPAVTYAKPAVRSYVAPAITYAKPAVTSYVAPAVTYAKPAVTSYVAPAVSYAKPAVTSYVAPTYSYAKPAVTSYAAPTYSYVEEAKPAVLSYSSDLGDSSYNRKSTSNGDAQTLLSSDEENANYDSFISSLVSNEQYDGTKGEKPHFATAPTRCLFYPDVQTGQEKDINLPNNRKSIKTIPSDIQPQFEHEWGFEMIPSSVPGGYYFYRGTLDSEYDFTNGFEIKGGRSSHGQGHEEHAQKINYSKSRDISTGSKISSDSRNSGRSTSEEPFKAFPDFPSTYDSRNNHPSSGFSGANVDTSAKSETFPRNENVVTNVNPKKSSVEAEEPKIISKLHDESPSYDELPEERGIKRSSDKSGRQPTERSKYHSTNDHESPSFDELPEEGGIKGTSDKSGRQPTERSKYQSENRNSAISSKFLKDDSSDDGNTSTSFVKKDSSSETENLKAFMDALDNDDEYKSSNHSSFSDYDNDDEKDLKHSTENDSFLNKQRSNSPLSVILTDGEEEKESFKPTNSRTQNLVSKNIPALSPTVHESNHSSNFTELTQRRVEDTKINLSGFKPITQTSYVEQQNVKATVINDKIYQIPLLTKNKEQYTNPAINSPIFRTYSRPIHYVAGLAPYSPNSEHHPVYKYYSQPTVYSDILVAY